MILKAALACEDVRVEADGAITIVGVRPDELRGTRLQDGTIALPRLLFITIIGGLRGHDSVEVRHRMVGSGAKAERALHPERHDPAADDHVFVYGDVPMLFPGEGSYEVVTEVSVGPEQLIASTTVRVTARQ